MYKYTKNNSREITSMPADQKRDEHGASFQSLPKINRKTHLHKMKVYNTRPVYSLTIETFTEVFTCSKAFNFPRSPLGTPGTTSPLLARTHKKMKRSHFQSLAAKASETKKDELELDVRIRHYHSTKKTNDVNHRNTAYSSKYTETKL